VTGAFGVRVPNDLWERPVDVVDNFLQGANASACGFPVIDAARLSWADFVAQDLHRGPVLLKGLLPQEWIDEAEDLKRESLLQRFGNENAWHIDGRHDHMFTSSSTSAAVTSLLNFSENIASGRLSRVGTGYDLALETKIFRALWASAKAPPLLQDFDMKPIVSVAMSRASGVQLHHHDQTWLALLHGSKAWWVATDPETAEVAAEGAEHTSHPCSWLERAPPAGLTFCVQSAGDVVYFGEKQKHATCNLQDYVFGIGSQGRLPVEWSELDRALHRGDVNAVKQITQQDSNADILFLRPPEAQFAGGSSPLHRAAKKGQMDLVQYLIEARADPGLTTSQGTEPLHDAVFNSHLPVVELLLRRSGNVNAEASDGARPLHVAARPGHPAVVEALLQAGANVNAADAAGEQALHIAASQGHSELCLRLLGLRANLEAPGTGGMRPSHMAAAGGHVPVLELLLKNKADIAAKDDRGMLPIGYAAAAGHFPLVDFIIKSAGAVGVQTPSSDGVYPLHAAAQGGHTRVLEALLRHGGSVHVRFGRGATALHLAAHRGRKEACKLLLQRGLDAEVADDAKVQPLHWAAAGGHLEIVKLLVSSGAEVRATDHSKNQALHFASGGGSNGIVAYLLGKKARIDARNTDQQRPLDVAIAGVKIGPQELKGGHRSVVELLLAKGAKVQPDDVQIAEDAGHMAISNVLAEALQGRQKGATNAPGSRDRSSDL